MSPLEPLLHRAFATARAADANTEIGRVRDEQGTAAKAAVSYEMVLEPDGGLEAVAEKVVPRLVYFLDCRGLKLDRAGGVFLSMFVGDTLHFLQVGDFFEVVQPFTGLSLEELVKKYGAASTGG